MASQAASSSEKCPAEDVHSLQAPDASFRATPSSAPVIDDSVIRVLSWNIRGRDDQNRSERLAAVYKVILTEAPDVVFLQELVPVGWRALKEAATEASAILSVSDGDNNEKRLVPHYGIVFGRRQYPYYCAVLLRLDVCQLHGRKTIPFPTSAMGRNLLLVRARVRGVNFTLLTTHLESLDVMSDERQVQLRCSLMAIKDAPASHCCLLGGDLNVHAWEVAAVGGIPAGAVDVWSEVGGDRHPDYTCDTVQDNNGSSLVWTECRRFDRFVFRPPQLANRVSVQPKLYRTVGRERINSCNLFPSDHLGILAQFTIQSGFEVQAMRPKHVQMTSIAPAAKVAGASSAKDVTDCTLTSAPSATDDVIRALSWNIDGLDHQDLVERSAAVYEVISREAPDVVFLQELVPIGWRAMKDAAAAAASGNAANSGRSIAKPCYGAVLGLRNCHYICAVLLRLDTCELIGRKTIPFPTTTMGRNLLLVRARVRGIDFTLLTTHLESFHVMSEKRKLQLRLSLMTVKGVPASQCALLGGDLNVRDWELRPVGRIPSGAVDVWQATGYDQNHKYTWDTEQNDNGGKREWTARRRFDRFVFRPPTNLDCAVVQPNLFRTVGRERIASCGRFPSDHWGILAQFKVQKVT